MENVLKRIGQTAGRVMERRQDSDSVERLSRQILEELDEVMRRKACNERWFQLESDEDLVEACVYESRELAASFVGAFLFVVVMYLCGWVQLMAISGMGPAAAFVTAVAPFIVVDLVKTIVGVLTARAVKRAIR